MDQASTPSAKRPRWKTILRGIGIGLGALIALAALWVYLQVRAFDASLERTYDVPVTEFTASADPEIVARGRHLSESISSCATSECHGADLSGGVELALGPLGTVIGTNITPAGLTGDRAYTDGELARLIQHGVKRNGRGVRFMPSHEIGWLPGSDVAAVVAYVRSVPAVSKPSPPSNIGVLGKILDRTDQLVLDVARRIDHTRPTDAPLIPEPTAKYGSYISRSCTGCHGSTFSGGRIPGAPASMATPANLTPHDTGLGAWSYADFSKLLDTGIRPDGRMLSNDMPYEALAKSNETERKALWAFLRSLPPTPFGNR